MTTEQKIIRAKVGLLELAKQLGNVSQACKMARLQPVMSWMKLQVRPSASMLAIPSLRSVSCGRPL